MIKNLFREHVERNVFLYFTVTTSVFVFILIFNKVYDKKIKNVEIFDYNTKKRIKLDRNKLSFVYLIDSFHEAEDNLLNIGELFNLAGSLKSPIYFLIKGRDVKKLQAFFELHDINENIYLTNRLVFWEYSKGRYPTLLIFKYNRLIYSDYGSNLNSKEKMFFLKKIIKDR